MEDTGISVHVRIMEGKTTVRGTATIVDEDQILLGYMEEAMYPEEEQEHEELADYMF